MVYRPTVHTSGRYVVHIACCHQGGHSHRTPRSRNQKFHHQKATDWTTKEIGLGQGFRAAPLNDYEAPLNDYEAGDKAPQAAPHPEAPDPKRPRHDDYDLKCVEELEADARLEVASMDLHSALMAAEEVLAIEFDRRKRELFCWGSSAPRCWTARSKLRLQ